MADDPHNGAHHPGTPAAPSPTTAPADAAPLPVGILCPDCGYDLRGSTSERCPECGFLLEPLRTGESQIPWSHRAQLGWFKAYWKTVWLVTARPKRFCQEMARPVSYADSQSFRWVTAAHAVLTIVVGGLVPILWPERRGMSQDEDAWWPVGGAVFTLSVWLCLLPGLASYFFQPRRLTVEQQNRAIALSYYAWAPLAFMVISLPCLVAALALGWPWGPTVADVLGVVAILVACLTPWVGYASLQAFAKYTLHLSAGARFVRMLLMSAALMGLTLLLALVPLSVFYFLLIIHSLR